MTDSNTNRNQTSTSNVITLAIAAGIILFGLVPGLLLTSLIDIAFPIKTATIWGLTLLSSIVIVFILYKVYKEDFKKTLLQYAKYSALLFIILSSVGLIAQGNIFYKYTSDKLFCSLEKKQADDVFARTEFQRGRFKFATINLDQLFTLLNTPVTNKESAIEKLGFKSFDDNISAYGTWYKRGYKKDKTDSIGVYDYMILRQANGSDVVEYRPKEKTNFDLIYNSLPTSGFSLTQNVALGDNENDKPFDKFTKGNQDVFTGYFSNYANYSISVTTNSGNATIQDSSGTK